MTPKGEPVFSSVKKSEWGTERKGEELEDRSNRERKYAIETDRCVCLLAPCCVESLVCVCMILTVWKMSLVSEREENYRHGNDLPDTSTLTSAVTPGNEGGGGGLEDMPASQRDSYNTAGAKNSHTHTHTCTGKIPWNSCASKNTHTYCMWKHIYTT